MKKSLLILTILASALTACTNKPQAGFGLEDSPIRYQTTQFEDPGVLAEAAGEKFTKDQILDKSPVLKDLKAQENEALIGLAYLQIEKKIDASKALGNIVIYLPEPKASIADILNRFDQTPIEGLNVVYKTTETDGLVAKYKDLEVTRDDLNSGNVVLQGIEERRFREIASQLNGQLSRILISEKAQSEKKDLQSFLENEVFKGYTQEASESELEAYLDSIGFAKSELTDELKPRFLDALKMRRQQHLMEEYVAQNILKGPVKVSFSEPQVRLKLNENWRPVLGYADAPISIVAFSGITCADCATFASNLSKIMKRYDGYLKLNWIHNFNSSDGVAKMMAEGALCVDSVKHGKALDFMNAFAKEGSQVDEQNFYVWANKNKVNVESFKRCFGEKSNDALLAQHVDYAHKVGIVANPTLWIEGRTIQGMITEDQLDRMVRNSIQDKRPNRFAAFWRHFKSYFVSN